MKLIISCAPLAQLDRALDFRSRGYIGSTPMWRNLVSKKKFKFFFSFLLEYYSTKDAPLHLCLD